MFTLNSANSVTKIFVITLKRARTCHLLCKRPGWYHRMPARHMWERGSLNWVQFMLQWFIRFPEFAEFTKFNEIFALFRKNSNVSFAWGFLEFALSWSYPLKHFLQKQQLGNIKVDNRHVYIAQKTFWYQVLTLLLKTTYWDNFKINIFSEILQGHILDSTYYTEGLLNNAELTTVNNKIITVTVDPSTDGNTYHSLTQFFISIVSPPNFLFSTDLFWTMHYFVT